MRWLAFAFLAFVAVVHAEFVPPAEGPVPFRRDRLPVDVDTISTLSRQVTVLAGANLPENETGLRAVAQMTGLALALDPANREARDLIGKLREGGQPDEADEKELERSCSRVWQILGWLEMPEAGADGQALAACLGDVMVFADPDHPKAKLRREKGEQGAWDGWIAPADSFKKKEAEPEEPEPEPMVKKPILPAVELADPSVPVPLWGVNRETKAPRFGIVNVNAKVIAGSESGKLEIKWGLEHPGDALQASTRGLAYVISKRFAGLQGGVEASFKWDEMSSYAPDRNGGVLSGTGAVLLDAAMTGKQPAAMAFAVVGEDGTLHLPPGFWASLRELSALKGTERLVLPAKAEDFLSALLVMDDAAFFMDHEVLLASTVEELCDLASASPKPGVAETLAGFGEIQKVGRGKSVGAFVAHPSTQVRLNRLAASMPQHASARFLALQGAGNRPRFLQRAILAREIRDAIQPIAKLNEPSTEKLLSKELDEVHETSRKKLDQLFSLIEIRDRDLHRAAVSVADNVRTLARTLDKQDRDYPYELRMKQVEMHHAVWAEYLKVLRLLTDTAGDGSEFQIPKPLAGS
ncbi:hypothetical protein [Luteolibacter luteus]|uniref:Uncharacterized protein n=1 Tax=Luteolibacter luteus TaxID=2728835 RepID=A0A858RHY6_9BACT|nr:hypothetical protein [Luteolibacter luteus]QJE96497.1 hypothetical protein HHL09_12120 [Luteolibacter luteus]